MARAPGTGVLVLRREKLVFGVAGRAGRCCERVQDSVHVEQEQGKPGGHCPLIVLPFKSAVAAPAEERLMSLALKVNGNLRP
jgi:hypothetical protein